MRQIETGTSYVVMLKVFLSSDHISPATGKTVAIVISKNGGAFGNPNAGATNATEVSAGWYKVTLDATDTNTLGDLVVRGTEGTSDPSEQVIQIVPNAADALLDRDMAAGADNSADDVRTVRSALRPLRNKFAVSGGTYTSYKEDDTTVNFTSSLTSSAGAEGITGFDPAGP